MKTKFTYALGVMLSAAFLMTSCSKNSEKSISPAKVDATGKTPKLASAAAGTTIWGASSQPFPGETLGTGDNGPITSWQRLNRRLQSKNGDIGLKFRRSYDTGIPANFSASGMAGDIGNSDVSVGEIKPDWIETANGTNFNQIKQYVQTFPAGRTIYLVFFHEPEDNVKTGYTFDVLQHAFAQFVAAVIAAGNSDVHPCYVLMSYTFKPASGRNPDNYNMGTYLTAAQKSQVIAGLDGYANDPTVTASQTFNANFNKMGTWGFTRFGIFETGVHANTTATARKNWIVGLGTWVNSRTDIELVSYFNSGIGENAGPTGWYLGNWYKTGTTYTWDDADGTIDAYAQLIK